MKKLLALLLVLGMTSVAGATLQISVNGNLEPIDSEIILDISDTIMLDIWTDADIPQFDGDAWMLVCDTSLGTITGGVGLLPMPQTLMGTPPDTASAPLIVPPPGNEGVWGIWVAMGAIDAGTIMYDDIVFHCEGQGDVTIYLMDAPEGQEAGIIHDAVVIHQIPEPMTIALLGLGGLFLLRRRK